METYVILWRPGDRGRPFATAQRARRPRGERMPDEVSWIRYVAA